MNKEQSFVLVIACLREGLRNIFEKHQLSAISARGIEIIGSGNCGTGAPTPVLSQDEKPQRTGGAVQSLGFRACFRSAVSIFPEYSNRYKVALRMMACTYSRVSLNGMDSTNS